MNYETWLADVPSAITDDTLWRTEVYRMALFIGDVAWHSLPDTFSELVCLHVILRP